MQKILIVGSIDFGQNNATSITLRNLFSKFNDDQIAFIMTGPYINTPQPVHKHIQVYRKWISPMNNTSNFIRQIKDNGSSIFGVSGSQERKSFKSLIYNKLNTTINAYRSLFPFEITPEVENFISTFRPDGIYSILGSVQIMNLCVNISKKFNIPIVPHFMDDWTNVQFKNDILLVIPRGLLNKSLKNVFERSKFGFTISEKMAIEYNRKYQLDFYPFMNCVESPTLKELSNNNNELVFTYAGGLHLNRYKTLIELCRAFVNIKSKNIIFKFFVSDKDWDKYSLSFHEFKFIKRMGYISNDDIIKELKNSNFLVHVESFDKKIMDYIRLSISTKIPEYLSVRRPIIALGPHNAASIEYLRENNAAIIFDETNIKDINNKLCALINSGEIINKITINGSVLFQRKHLKTEQQNNFHALLTKI